MKNKLRILFVNTEEVSHISAIGLPPYQQWIADVTGLSNEQIITCNVADGDELPNTFEEIHGIIGGGSSHSPYEDTLWIKKTGNFFKKAHKAGIPQLLNCFSHQIFAAALGGETGLGEKERRFGIEVFYLTPDGKKDPLYKGLPDQVELFTSHGDIVTKLPPSKVKIVELAETDFYPYECLAYEGKTRTLQTHPELQGKVMQALATARTHSLAKGGAPIVYSRYLNNLPSDEKIAAVEANGKKIFSNWLRYYVMPTVT